MKYNLKKFYTMLLLVTIVHTLVNAWNTVLNIFPGRKNYDFIVWAFNNERWLLNIYLRYRPWETNEEYLQSKSGILCECVKTVLLNTENCIQGCQKANIKL